MLTSNVGLSMATHYCQGQAVESKLVFGHESLDCGMQKMNEVCEIDSSQSEHLKSKPCCENEYQTLQLDENVKSQSNVKLTNPVFLVAFVHAFIKRLVFNDQAPVQFADYTPPLPDEDIQVLFQTFLI